MKKILSTVVLFNFFLASTSSLLFPRVNFGSRDSAFKVSSGASFNVGSSNWSVDGSLKQAALGAVTGNAIEFNGGVLELNGLELLMTAQYDPTSNDTVRLTGNSNVRVESGSVIKTITVSGTGNRLEGQPTLSEIIPFITVGSELTIAIQNVLNRSIVLNGGTLILGDNLTLADGTQIIGPGTVDLDRYRLSLGGYYPTAWASDLTFQNSTDITLNGDILVNGTWMFEGTNRINGNGATLDLSAGGELSLAAGATLHLTDIYIKGLSDSAGKILFVDAAGKVRFSNSIVELAGNYTTSIGQVVIDGETTFLLKDKNWIFDTDGMLNVQDRLWLDVCLFPDFSDAYSEASCGQLIMGTSELFDNHLISQSIIDQAIFTGNLEIGANGAIKEKTDRAIGLDTDEGKLLSGSVITNLVLNRSVHVNPDKFIKIDANVTIDGRGVEIIFSNPVTNPRTKASFDSIFPQFIVSPGVSVTLRNIDLSRINANTFRLGEGSQILIGENVTFGLAEDVVFDSGQIVVLNPIQFGSAETFNVFKIFGEAGKKKFILTPPPGSVPPFAPLMRLQLSSLIIQNIDFDGLEFVTANTGLLGGSIALAGNSMVRVATDTSMNFDVEDINNYLVILNDALTLSGTISFLGAAAENSLTVKFSLIDPLDNTLPLREGVDPKNPLLILQGDPCIFLASDSNLARLIFDDSSLSIINKSSNAFDIQANSFLTMRRLEILGNPIKQESAQFSLEAQQRSGLGIDGSFVRAKVKSSRRPNTAFIRMRQKQKVEKPKVAKAKAGKPAKKETYSVPKHNLNPQAKQGGKKKHKTRDMDEMFDEGMVTRALAADVIFSSHHQDTTITLENPAQDNQEYTNARIQKFFTEPGHPADLTTTPPTDLLLPTPFHWRLHRDCTIIQDRGIDTSLQISAPDELGNVMPLQSLSVDGKRNVIEVSGLFEFDVTNLTFGDGGELEFQGLTDDARIHITAKGNLGKIDLEVGAKLIFNNIPVTVDHNVIFNGKTADGKTAVVTLQGSKAEFIIKPQAEATPDAAEIQGHVFMAGQLIVNCTNGARLAPTSGILNLAPTAGDVVTYQGGAGGILSSRGGKIIFGQGDVSMRAERNASISVRNGGIIEFNNEVDVLPVRAFDGTTLTKGHVRSLVMSDSNIFAGRGSRFVFGANEVEGVVPSESLLSVNLSKVDICGEGFVEFVGLPEIPVGTPGPFEGRGRPYKGFVGKIQRQDCVEFVNENMLVSEFVGFLVNINPSLTSGKAFEYIGEDGNRFIRTKDGISAPLIPGDVLTTEQVIEDQSILTGVITGRNTISGLTVTVAANGTITRS